MANSIYYLQEKSSVTTTEILNLKKNIAKSFNGPAN